MTDQDLIDMATQLIKRRYLKDRHTIGAAVRMRSGAVFAGVNLNTYIGNLAVCAESVVIGMAITLGNDEIDTIVAVRHPPPEESKQDIAVVAPCGACRERIFDYGPQAKVIVPRGEHLVLEAIEFLLPHKYSRPL